MALNTNWLHGTEVFFCDWKLPIGRPPHKRGLDALSGIFFTSDEPYAIGASEGTGGLCSVKLLPGFKVLDMNKCSAVESEMYRKQVEKKKIAKNNVQVVYPQYWNEGWKSGLIMKYAPLCEKEQQMLYKKNILAVTKKSTQEGISAFNELQLLTRNYIDELVVAAKELGYDAVVGNEIDTLDPRGPQTYKILFVLNPACITPPSWLSKPM